MKTILYLMITLFMSASITSCTPTSLAEQTETQNTGGEDGQIEEEDDDGTGD